MSGSTKFFCFLFILLAVGSVAHDVYIWQNAPGYPFSFAAIGWIIKNYYPDELQLTIDTLSPETFNSVLTPVLKIPAFFLTAAIAALIFVVDFISRTIKNHTAAGKYRDDKIKFNKKVR